MKQNIQLHHYIDTVGQVQLAELLDCTKATISNWYRYSTPVPPVEAFKLIELSHGSLTWASIYEPYMATFFKKKKINRADIGVQLKFPF